MKLFNLVLFICLLFIGRVWAEGVNPTQPSQIQTPVTVPQQVSYTNCTKIFSINAEKLYFLTIGAINANNFGIDEMQTADGYIIFSVAKKQYLATIAKIDNANSMLKITPCNNVYIFPPGILQNMFKYIELNLNS